VPATKTFAHVPTAPFNGGTLASHGVASATVASVSVVEPRGCALTNKKLSKFSFVAILLLCGLLLDKNNANNAHAKSVRSIRRPRFSLLLFLDEEVVTLLFLIIIFLLTSL